MPPIQWTVANVYPFKTSRRKSISFNMRSLLLAFCFFALICAYWRQVAENAVLRARSDEILVMYFQNYLANEGALFSLETTELAIPKWLHWSVPEDWRYACNVVSAGWQEIHRGHCIFEMRRMTRLRRIEIHLSDVSAADVQAILGLPQIVEVSFQGCRLYNERDLRQQMAKRPEVSFTLQFCVDGF